MVKCGRSVELNWPARTNPSQPAATAPSRRDVRWRSPASSGGRHRVHERPRLGCPGRQQLAEGLDARHEPQHDRDPEWSARKPLLARMQRIPSCCTRAKAARTASEKPLACDHETPPPRRRGKRSCSGSGPRAMPPKPATAPRYLRSPTELQVAGTRRRRRRRLRLREDPSDPRGHSLGADPVERLPR